MGKVLMGAAVSVVGFIADDQDGVGALFDWYHNGDVAVALGNPDGASTSARPVLSTCKVRWATSVPT